MRVSIGYILGCVALWGCGDKTPQLPEPESRPVKLQTVAVGDLPISRSFPGIVEAGDKAILTFRVSGRLASVDVKAGSEVKKGQQLASLNTDEFLLAVEEAQANYELAHVQYRRNKKLRQNNVVSEIDFDTTRSALKQAEAELSRQKSNLSYATLLAPYNGTLSLSMVENHEFVQAKEPVMHIQSAGLINIAFQLPERLLYQFNKTSAGNEVAVSFDSIPGQTYTAAFKEIDTESDTKTSSYKVTLSMEKPQGVNILPGMAGMVRLTLAEGQAGMIPQRALLFEAGKSYVWRVDKQGMVHKVAVEIGRQNQIINGLNNGDIIAISGVEVLQEGQKVRAWVKERGL